ncbi:MAG TPA: hypothetical protein VEC12_01170 [Bacteroidia bacterium]|nr:hypothetical protein [Bacteroidia bacterium]
MINRNLSILVAAAAVVSSCTAPRVINQSGMVTPKGNFTGGASYTANLPTATTGLLWDVAAQTITEVANKDSISVDEALKRINKAAIGYGVDPIGTGYDFYLRYGLFDKFEIGYKLAGTANVFMTQYQFLTPYEAGEEPADGLHGSIGLQYSFQNFDMPDKLEALSSRLGYKFKRKDFLVPVIFSYAFGRDEKYGSIAFGMAYSYSHINYTTLPDRVFDANGNPVFGVQNKQGYSAFGGFLNLKLGYKYVYVIPAFSMFYQNYGSYRLIDGSSFSMKGLTIVPSISLQLTTGNAIKRKRAE